MSVRTECVGGTQRSNQWLGWAISLRVSTDQVQSEMESLGLGPGRKALGTQGYEHHSVGFQALDQQKQ